MDDHRQADGDELDRLRKQLAEAEQVIAEYVVERDRLDIETTRIQGMSEASKYPHESSFDTTIRLLRRLGAINGTIDKDRLAHVFDTALWTERLFSPEARTRIARRLANVTVVYLNIAPSKGDRLPRLGELVMVRGPTGFSLVESRVVEYSDDDERLFRCHELDVWYGLSSEWKGPFDLKRPLGKLWRRMTAAEIIERAEKG